MTATSKVIYTLLLLTAAIDLALIGMLGFSVPWRDFLYVFFIIVALGSITGYCRWRRIETIALFSESMMQLSFGAVAFVVLQYLCATFNFPLVDSHLIAADRALGVSIPAIVTWVRAHPALSALLVCAYNSLLFQTLFVIVFFSVLNQRPPLERFVAWFTISLAICILVFTLFPAAGPRATLAFSSSPDELRYLDQLLALRNGSLHLFSFDTSEGMITFPSFHTAWAILLTLAFWKRWTLFIFSAILNMLVLISVATVGGHYVIDIPTAIVVVTFAVLLTRQLTRPTAPGDGGV